MESTSNTDLVILGDFNYPAIDWNTMDVPSNLVNESLFLEKVKDLLLEQIVTVPTRHRVNQNSNILDLVITNNVFVEY